MNLCQSFLTHLKNKPTGKNLLAFSAGVDSVALFFILLNKNIKFDIAIINYNQRTQSVDEVSYTKKLCKLHNKKCFIKEFPNNAIFSEKSARDFRYNFFEELIEHERYAYLLTAHQLNDKFEWFLMQMSKGAGVAELLGISDFEKRDNYTIIRPLLEITKKELVKYLDKQNLQYFIDKSNFDEKYKRNHIRVNYSDKFLEEYSQGVKSSFQYLKIDYKSLFKNTSKFTKNELTIFKYSGDDNIAIKLIDKELKTRGILITKATRDEILKQKEIIVSDKIAISITQFQIWIVPKCNEVMTKDFKEKCRISRIPKNIRGYLSREYKTDWSSIFLLANHDLHS
jgi:tRNA(Ile)-lysidine synthase